MADVYGFEAVSIDGKVVPMSQFRGQVLLIVNTASRCGFTPQFDGLQGLYTRFKDRGFSVLGFPCNQFRRQDPGANSTIAEFCQANYGVTFPMFAKVDVNGRDAHPLFLFLEREARGVLWTQSIKWNFTKFLIARDGNVTRRFGPNVAPQQISPAIEQMLASASA